MTIRVTSRILSSPAVLGCLVGSLACAPTTGESKKDDLGGAATGGSPAGSGSASGSGSTPGTAGGSSVTGAGGTTFVDPGTGSGGGDAGLAADAACAQSVLKPEAIEVIEEHQEQINCTAQAPGPIALYIVLDNSGSMDDNNKWTDAVAALTAFVQTPPASGSGWTCVDLAGNPVTAPPDLPPPGAGSMSVAIQYFHPQGVPNADECNGAAHAQPAVPMGPIPANGPAIVASLGNTGPSGNTPTVGALTGGANYCLQYQAQNPDVKCVNVLVTDGQPNGCGLSSSCGLFQGQDCVDPDAQATLTPIAANASSRGVTTFTIGMDGITAEGFTLLNAIAVAGGSDCTPGTPGAEACNVTSGGSQGFLDALNGIRDTVQVTEQSSQTFTTTVKQTTTLECTWAVPPAPEGKAFDPGLVNVSITPGGGSAQKIGFVLSEADCAAAGDGWYYDDNAAPKQILSCPNTCTTIKGDPDLSVNVLFGCATEPVEIH